MTLHIYSKDDGCEKFVIAMEFDCLQQLEPTFEKFRRATGVRLSEYDDAELGAQHLALLSQLFDEASIGTQRSVEFIKVVGDAAKIGGSLKFVGE